ncbi:MAG: MFS transporter [Roseibium sp.]
MISGQTSLTTGLLQDPRTYALLLASTLTVLAVATISPALAGLEARFQHEPNAALLTRLLVPAPSLSVALLAPFIGVAADRYGKVRVLIGGVGLFAISGSAGYYLDSLVQILASRLVLGIAVAMIMTSYTALIGDCFEGDRRMVVMGWQVSARNFGGFVFISVGGLLAAMSPQLPFLIYGVAALFIPVIWFAFRDQETDQSSDSVGVKQTEEAAGWLLPVIGLSALVCLTVVMFFQMPTQVPFFTAFLGLESVSTTAYAMGALTLTGGVVALWNGWLKRQLGRSGMFALGYAVMATGFAILAFNTYLGPIVIGASVIGAGFAVLMPAYSDLLLRIVPASRRGAASGALATGAFLGQFISPLISLPVVSVFGYANAFLGSAVFLATMSAGALFGRIVLRRPVVA